jgi:hypothetical protein
MILEWILLIEVMVQWIGLDWLGVRYRHFCWLMLTCVVLERHRVGTCEGSKRFFVVFVGETRGSVEQGMSLLNSIHRSLGQSK